MGQNVDIFKFDKPKQFPIDEILNESERRVRGWMGADIRDNDGEEISVSELKRVMGIWMKRGAPINDLHSNRKVGQGLNWSIEEHPEAKVPAIKIEYEIYDDYTIDDEVWEEIKNGRRKGLSLGGRATQKPKLEHDNKTDELTRKLRGMELYEISSVDNPCNELAMNTEVNYLAKGNKEETPSETENKLFKDLQKGFSAVDVEKPFGGFDSFSSCLEAQEGKGHSKDSAQRICGFIQARTENKFKTEGFTKQDDDDIVKQKPISKTEQNNKDIMKALLEPVKKQVKEEDLVSNLPKPREPEKSVKNKKV